MLNLLLNYRPPRNLLITTVKVFQRPEITIIKRRSSLVYRKFLNRASKTISRLINSYSFWVHFFETILDIPYNVATGDAAPYYCDSNLLTGTGF